MSSIPKNLNLKAAFRVNDAPLNLVVASRRQSTSSEAAPKEIVPESIVVESQPNDVKSSFSGDELSPPPPPAEEFEYDDEGESDFKSPPPSILNSHFRVELTEDDSQVFNSAPKVERPEHDPIASRRLAELVHPDHVEGASLQSFSDVDSISEHSIHSDTSYTKEAFQITQQQQSQSNQFTSLKEPPSPSSSTAMEPPRKRRRAINKPPEDPAKLPLCDLLFYNPPPTIFQSKAQEDVNNNSEEATKKVVLPVKKRRSSRSSSVASQASNRSLRGSLDFDIDVLKSGDENFEKDISTTANAASDEPVLMLDESGNIVIKNPNALSNDKDKKPEAKMKSSTTYNSFRRRERSKNIWNTEETGMFYTALEIVGTDFSLMEAVFFKDRNRSRKQLKQKFKREEKTNRDYIDTILYKSLRNRSKLNSHLIQAAGAGASPQAADNTGANITSPVGSVDANIVLQSA